MIKKIAITLAILGLTLGVNAQYKTIKLGLRAGANLGWVRSSTDGYESQGMRAGYSWGFVSEFYFMENYAVQTGFNIQSLRGKLEYPAIIGNESGYLLRKYKLSYIQIPVTVKMKANLTDLFTFYGRVGFGAGFNIDGKARDIFTPDTGGAYAETEQNIQDEINLFRGSLILGLGGEYAIKGSTSLFVDIALDNGFIDILTGKENERDPELDHKAINSCLELSVGVIF